MKHTHALFALATLTFLVFSLSQTSASVNDWTSYGLDAYSRNAQYPQSSARLDLNFTQTNGTLVYLPLENDVTGTSWESILQKTQYQPIVTSLFENVNTEFLIFPNYNYTEIYDKNMVLVGDNYVANTYGQISSYLDSVARKFMITELSRYNATTLQYRSFYANTNYSFIEAYQLNITINATWSSAGIKCVGQDCFFIISNKIAGNYTNEFFKITGNSLAKQFNISSTLDLFREPPSRVDMNGDGINEYVVFNPTEAIVFNENGAQLFVVKRAGSAFIQSARFFKGDATTSYKLAVITTDSASSTFTINTYKSDGSSFWSRSITAGGTGISGDMAMSDYNLDAIDELYIGFGDSISSAYFYVLNGADGTILKSEKRAGSIQANFNGVFSLTLARLTNNTQLGFIISSVNTIYIFDIATNTTFSAYGATPRMCSCIPADLNVDSTQEIICMGYKGNGDTGSYSTIFKTSAPSNQNPTITSLTFSPSSTIPVGDKLTIFISAIDAESDTIYYSYQCDEGLGFVPDSTSSSANCTYSNTGYANFTVRVHDSYHTTNNSFSYPIQVITAGGLTCNNNFICESGETYANCPNDCANNQTITIGGTNGTAQIPTEIVSLTDSSQGLLPEIYRAILAFFSYTLIPLVSFMFLILIVMVIIAVGTVVKKLMGKMF